MRCGVRAPAGNVRILIAALIGPRASLKTRVFAAVDFCHTQAYDSDSAGLLPCIAAQTVKVCTVRTCEPMSRVLLT